MAEHSDSLDQLATALAAAQAEFGAVPKNATNPFFKNRYADLASVVAHASPVASRHGLSVTQFLGFDGEHDTLTTWLLHISGQFIAETMRLHLSKEDSQGHGSATSYAKRYAYMAALGLVADEDDDGNKAAARSSRARTTNGRSSEASKPATSLSEGTLAGVLDALVTAKPSNEKLRMQLVALGVQDVPQGKISRQVIEGLSEEQAVELGVWCESLRASA